MSTGLASLCNTSVPVECNINCGLPEIGWHGLIELVLVPTTRIQLQWRPHKQRAEVHSAAANEHGCYCEYNRVVACGAMTSAWGTFRASCSSSRAFRYAATHPSIPALSKLTLFRLGGESLSLLCYRNPCSLAPVFVESHNG